MNHGGDLDSTLVTKPEVHAERVVTLVKQLLQHYISANDADYALAAETAANSDAEVPVTWRRGHVPQDRGEISPGVEPSEINRARPRHPAHRVVSGLNQ